ncbi:hypothetical protein J3S90_05985 [Flavobacterium sp. P4023]|uniref:DUF4394 domain-containing protein n=1 Tax=Flavobacterium flabelliforme TaxID=2816119 RepID=A0ABS5CRX9_9FLAO|nr:hypothetical protein [Flavobacterium flabelliforme]MBP4141349.1 hypothetical protein [Flavobacterium flabelliforme]
MKKNNYTRNLLQIRKNSTRLFFSLIVSIFFFSCDTQDEKPAGCADVEILGYNIEQGSQTGNFGSSLNSLTVPNFTVLSAVTQPVTFQSSGTNNAVFNPLTNEYLLISGEKGILTKVNTATNTSSATAIPLYSNTTLLYRVVNAPVIVGGVLYYGCYDFTNQIFSLVDANFNIIPSSSTPIPQNTLAGYNLQTFTAATDGVNAIYFLLGNRIITYNNSNISTAIVSAAIALPAGGSSGLSFISLEFKQTNILYAIMEDAGVSNSKLYELNVSNPLLISKTPIYSFAFNINSEFYSTVYDNCNKIFYVSTLQGISGYPNGQISKIDVSGTPTLLSTTPTTFVELGLTLKK